MSITKQTAHPAQRRYPPEMKERAVRMVLETIERSGDRHGVVGRVARQVGVGTESLRAWVRQAEVDGGRRPGLPTEDRRRIRARQGGSRAPSGQRDPAGGLGFLCAGARPATAEVVAFIDCHRDDWGVEPTCEVLQFAPPPTTPPSPARPRAGPSPTPS
jgi:transposase-like protein